MFFCEACRVKNDWPQSFGGSYGRCEICGNEDSCYDVSSKLLPIPKLGTELETKKDVHTAHCCQKHGCKYAYGYKDQKCTVVQSGGQEGMCSFCWEEIYEDGGYEDAQLMNEMYNKGVKHAHERFRLIIEEAARFQERLRVEKS